MSGEADDLDKLLVDVRRTILDNKQFLEKLVDETVTEDSEDEMVVMTVDEDLEEL